MLASYLKITLRNLLRNRVLSAISILSLATGLTVCFFIYQYTVFELSYEDSYRDNDRIYRISYQKYLDQIQTENIAKSPAALASALRTQVPEVELAARMLPINNLTISPEKSVRFNSEKAFLVDTSFIKIFTPEMRYGTCGGEGILISESVAQKYFTTSDPVNSIVSTYDEERFDDKIIGVFKDIPENTHMSYDVLIVNTKRTEDNSWQWTGCYTYVKLKERASLVGFEARMNAIARANSKSKFNVDVKLTPQPLNDIHLRSDLQEEISPNGDRRSIMFLVLIGCLVLITAWVNYINMTIAKSTERLKEIGIRKVIGSQKIDLVRQFLLEAALFKVVSLVIAISLALFLSPSFRALSGKELFFGDLLKDPYFWIGIVLVVSIGVFLTGLYPAFIYARLRPINALKGTINNSVNSGTSFRKVLLIFQFSTAAFLIVGTLIIHLQMNFMQQSDLGMDVNKIVVVKSPNMLKEQWSDKLSTYVIDSGYYNRVKLFKHTLSANNSFTVASTSHIPGKELNWGTEGFRREDADPDKVYVLYMAGVDYDFFPSFKINIVAGRNFSEQHQTDQLMAVMINEEAAGLLGFDNPEMAIGKSLRFYDTRFEIIGVVANYHQESLKRSIKPTFYQLLPRALDYMAVSVPSGNLPQSISTIKENWSKAFGDSPFEYFFLDDFFNRQYKADQKFGELFTVFSILSQLIACVGLFGLSSYLLKQRVKEIGIRKVLGATVVNILKLLAGYYLKIVLIASLIATPFSYMVMTRWLNSFAFRINLEWWMFVVPLAVILVVAMATISFQSIKSSLVNPVASLRSE